MKKLQNICGKAYFKIISKKSGRAGMLCGGKNGGTGIFCARKSGGKEVIMEFALGAIAIVLAVLFRDQLETVISTIGHTFNQKIQAMFTAL